MKGSYATQSPDRVNEMPFSVLGHYVACLPPAAVGVGDRGADDFVAVTISVLFW